MQFRQKVGVSGHPSLLPIEVEGTGPFILLLIAVPMLLDITMETTNKCNETLIDYYVDAIIHQ